MKTILLSSFIQLNHHMEFYVVVLFCYSLSSLETLPFLVIWKSFALKNFILYQRQWFQSSSVAQLCLTLCNPMDFSMPGLPVHHQLQELTQTHVHQVRDAIQLSHSLLSPSPPVFNLSHHQGLFQGVSSSHQVAKVLEFQLQHQSFQWIFRTDFL